MVKPMILLLILCHTTPAVKHTLEFHVTMNTGVIQFPHYLAMEILDGVIMGYYDDTMETADPREDWVRNVIKVNPRIWEEQVQFCKKYKPMLKDDTFTFTCHSSHTEDIHIIQHLMGCEWDDATGQSTVFSRYGYNGEDYISLNVEEETWNTSNSLAGISKQKWSGHRDDPKYWKSYLGGNCPVYLMGYLYHGNSSIHRRDLPSVSLLQKNLSSPVSCHATGFYPNKAVLLWRKDGTEFNSGLKPGDILPNHDGSFQMTVYLNVSSITLEDRKSFQCVFQFSDVKNDIITISLDKAEIRNNKPLNIDNEEEPSNRNSFIIAAVIVLLVIIIAAVGFAVYKKKQDTSLGASADNIHEVTVLNPAINTS